ncbi:hypothetical protein ACFL17_09485, partial [Pseudomonadota bacterium]
MRETKILKGRPYLLIAAMTYLVAILVNGYYQVLLIQNSTSSTAAIGYIYLPIIVLVISLPWLVVGLSLGYSIKAFSGRSRKDITLAMVGGLLSLVYLAYVIHTYQKHQELTEVVLAIERMNTEHLDRFVKTSAHKTNKYALAAVALNSSTAATTLADIVAFKAEDLHDRMWEDSVIMGANRKGLA